jgi:potassium uptake TrkH family protein
MKIVKIINSSSTVISLLCLFSVFLYFGSKVDSSITFYFQLFIKLGLAFGVVTLVLRYLKERKFDLTVLASDIFFMVFFLLIIFNKHHSISFFKNNLIFVLGALFLFIREFSTLTINYKRKVLNPAQLFIISFLGIIFLGAFCLQLPNATTEKISFLDALFTSTSAVCVTGLSVVDTQYTFTTFGKVIIMILIQIGGLGIMTFASYFSYFFKGSSSYENTLVLGELTSENKISEVFRTIKKILILTSLIVFIGAVSIYFTTPAKNFDSFLNHLFFSVFHSVSAFNNAGFSTLSAGMYDDTLKFNYSFHLIISFLIIFGGMGFPIVFNVIRFFKYKMNLLFNRFFDTKKVEHVPWVINLNTRIILITTFILLVVGTVAFYFFEYNGVLKDHNDFGKIVTAFFGSVTPRTAGFNTFDMADLSFPTVMFTILLMWIGASPASTGGGIKTSTFAIATLNFVSLAKGKDRIEINRREVADISVRRAFAIISLSLAVIGLAVLILVKIEPDKSFIHLAFEAFSAFSTVGLSINLTPRFGEGGKIVLICLMFIGRISTLTMLIAIFRKTKYKNYKYPKEEILIN